MSRKKQAASTEVLPPEAYDTIPRLQLTFADESVWMTKYDARGAPTVTYPVAAKHIGNAIHAFGASTGLLAPDTLWWTSKQGMAEIAVWLPPVPRTVTVQVDKHEHKIILPPLGFVFVGRGLGYCIFAALERPMVESAQLYRTPLPNVHPSGEVCPGNVPFPKCSAATICEAAKMFFESYFNQHLDNNRINGDVPLLKQLQAMSGKRKFPAELLVPAATVGELMRSNDDELD